MAPPYHVYIKCYDDLAFLKEAVDSIPADVPVHVVDGRYADFPGETIRTPGCREWCEQQTNVTYHTPPDDRLPWGHERVESEPHLRHPIHEQAKWANYEVLPQDEWVLHMDADEQLVEFDRDWLRQQPPHLKFVPFIDSLAERGIGVPRLYQPGQWTFWIAGVMYPREFWSRDTPVEKLVALHGRSLTHQAINRKQALSEVRISNAGDERPPTYHLRRADQLATMGRTERARQYVDKVDARTSDEANEINQCVTIDDTDD